MGNYSILPLLFLNTNVLFMAMIRQTLLAFSLLFLSFTSSAVSSVRVGSEVLLQKGRYDQLLRGKRIGLLTNHSAVTSQLVTTLDLLQAHERQKGFRITALFAPEHGLRGVERADDAIIDELYDGSIPVYSLHGARKRPTREMLETIDILFFDIQDVGCRSYTYISTMCAAMEAAAEAGVPMVVLDRPNPLGGNLIDGPVLEDKYRSVVGYLNVPYCHGMTVGELASYYNHEYHVGCQLWVVPMDGWHRSQSFEETGLTWIPTSPQIPEASTPWYYSTTGVIGELQIVSIGVGYTLPFKVVGAPWIDAQRYAAALNKQKFPGVYFQPFHYKPFFGRFAREACQGVLIQITDRSTYKPVQTQYLLLGILKSLYPKEFNEAFQTSAKRKEMFDKINGTAEPYKLLATQKNVVWPLRRLHEKQRKAFAEKRKKYLIPSYL